MEEAHVCHQAEAAGLEGPQAGRVHLCQALEQAQRPTRSARPRAPPPSQAPSKAVPGTVQGPTKICEAPRDTVSAFLPLSSSPGRPEPRGHLVRRWKRPNWLLVFVTINGVLQQPGYCLSASWVAGLLWLGSLLRCPSLRPAGGLAGVLYEPSWGPPPRNSGPAAAGPKPQVTKGHQLRPGLRAALPLPNFSRLGQGLRTVSWDCGRVRGPPLQTPQHGPLTRMMLSRSPLSAGPGVLLRDNMGVSGDQQCKPWWMDTVPDGFHPETGGQLHHGSR